MEMQRLGVCKKEESSVFLQPGAGCTFSNFWPAIPGGVLLLSQIESPDLHIWH